MSITIEDLEYRIELLMHLVDLDPTKAPFSFLALEKKWTRDQGYAVERLVHDVRKSIDAGRPMDGNMLQQRLCAALSCSQGGERPTVKDLAEVFKSKMPEVAAYLERLLA